ncbi:MAG: hypothetical protein F6J97_05345 [Leptolyngbya sp. SIO4C1]|nr:hypothetical protein [Leptolyngbya sp. SIO4C1]
MVTTFQSSTSISDIVNEIFRSRCITRQTQQCLMAALLDKRELSQQEKLQVNRVVDALHRGLLRVID